jgi:hypothetical protein
MGLAETEGFEPSVQMYPYDGLANRWFQPLTHVSGSQRRGRGYSEGVPGRQGAVAAIFRWGEISFFRAHRRLRRAQMSLPGFV